MTLIARSAAILFAIVGFIALPGKATHARPPDTPGAATRSSASNFKDMVLAICIARSQQGQAAADAAGSANALIEWTRYDAEKSPDEIDRMVNRFLSKDYRNPLGEHEVSTAGFDLLKCLDLYHSRDLDSLAKRVVLSATQRPAKLLSGGFGSAAK